MNIKVGVIDDSTVIQRSIKKLLGSTYDVFAASSGYEGFRMISEEKPDCIILDIEMDELSGLDVCRILRGSVESHDLPIIILSSNSGEFDLAKGLLVGADKYMVKPFTKEGLIEHIKSVLN